MTWCVSILKTQIIEQCKFRILSAKPQQSAPVLRSYDIATLVKIYKAQVVFYSSICLPFLFEEMSDHLFIAGCLDAWFWVIHFQCWNSLHIWRSCWIIFLLWMTRYQLVWSVASCHSQSSAVIWRSSALTIFCAYVAGKDLFDCSKVYFYRIT